jgi:hypothetical protein
MHNQSKKIKVKSTATDIWKIVSNTDTPEEWIPFLDSRVLTNDKQEPNVYFPSQMAHICQDKITFDILNISPENKFIEVSLSFGLLQIKIAISVIHTKNDILLDVATLSDVPVSHVPEIEDILLGVATEVAFNIEQLASIKYPVSKNEVTDVEAPSLLSERHPEMNISKIERISLHSGINKFMAQTRPVIISDYGSEMKNFSSMNQYSWWLEHFGSQTIPYALFNDLAYDENCRDGMTTLSMFISLLESNPNNLQFAIYENPAANILGLYKYLMPPNIIPKDCPVMSANIWMGSPHVKSPMHQDGRKTDCTGQAPDKTHNLNFQIKGRKHVILAHPNQTPNIYAKPTSMHKSRFPEIEVDLFKPIDLNKYPLIQEASFFEEILHPGELLYVPRGWWHAFYALENSINYNVFFSSHY